MTLQTWTFQETTCQNKKVLLRERKRHTAHRVASTPYVVLTGYPPGQGTPPARVPPWPGYPPSQGTPRPGYPPGQGTPHQGTPLARVPPTRVPPWPGYPQPGYPPPGYPPSQGTPPPGYPPGWTWQGTPPAGPGRVPPRAAPWHSGKCCKALWDTGTLPKVWTDWKHYLPHPSDAGGKNPSCNTWLRTFQEATDHTDNDWQHK